MTKDFSSYGKGIGVLVNKGAVPNFVEYDVTMARAGLYQLELRYAAAQSRPCTLTINGRLVKSDAAGKVTGGWNPDSQAWAVEGFFRLESGKNVLRLEHPQYFPHIDKLLIAPAPAVEAKLVQDLQASGKSSNKDRPQPLFVRQWVRYLDKTKDEANSVFALWRRFAAEQAKSGDGLTKNPAAKSKLTDRGRQIAARLLASRPSSLVELADRYQKLFAEADRAWRKLKSGPAGKNLKALPDRVQEAFRQLLYDPQGPLSIPENVEEAYDEPTLAMLRRHRKQLGSLEKSLPRLPEAMAVSEGEVQDLRVHLRGSHLTLGDVAPRGFPRIIAGESPQPIDRRRSGRLELAHWITRGDHPLTARVMVNRIWQGHFGEGLVRTPANFGRLGERPSHPQLLDWLAARFVRSGWSVKAMHRIIMASSSYQMSTAWNEQAAAIDPQNRLLWRVNRRRLEAEAIRDSILAVSGRLDGAMGGSLLRTPNRKYVTSTANVNPVVYQTARRSIYLPVVRSALYEVLQAFDFPDPSVLSARRQSTTVAPQALFMMNSKLVARHTKAMAAALLAEEMLDDAGRVHLVYEKSYGRLPTEQESARALEYVKQYQKALESREPDGQVRRRRAWQSLCRAIISANEFIYLD